MFGHSYLKQLFQTLGGTNTIASSEWISDGTTLEGTCGSSKRFGAPWCGYDGANCHTGNAVKHTFANGATVTGVFNYGPLQAQENSSKMEEFITAGGYTHALVMEPHADTYFTQMKAIDMGTMTRAGESWKEPTYGCGWSDNFWAIWDAKMPGKVRHVVPWGNTADPAIAVGNTTGNITETFMSATSSSTSASTSASANRYHLQTIVNALPCIAESKHYRTELMTSHGIQGHHCVAAYDESAFYLGPIPYMMAGALQGFILPA